MKKFTSIIYDDEKLNITECLTTEDILHISCIAALIIGKDYVLGKFLYIMKIEDFKIEYTVSRIVYEII